MKHILLTLLGLIALTARGAQSYHETFDAGSATAETTLSLGAGSWTISGGSAKVIFDETAPFTVPEVATLTPVSGSFTGNYVAAGIGVLGFRFRAAGEAPSVLYVELAAGTSVYQRILGPVTPGAWASYQVSLDSAEAGNWSVKRGSRAGFAAALAEVKSVSIKVRRSGATAMEYEVDDLFVDGLPAVVGGSTTAGQMSLAWDALQVGAPYRMERSETLNGPWQDAGSVTPTGRQFQLKISADPAAPLRFYRLRVP